MNKNINKNLITPYFKYTFLTPDLLNGSAYLRINDLDDFIINKTHMYYNIYYRTTM